MNWLLRIIAVEIKMHVHQNLLMTLTKLVLLFIGTTEKKNKYTTFKSLYFFVRYGLKNIMLYFSVPGSELLQSQSPNNLFDHSTLTRDQGKIV